MKYLTDFRKKVETCVDPRLFRIGGLEERKCWRVVRNKIFIGIFGSTLHICFASFNSLAY